MGSPVTTGAGGVPVGERGTVASSEEGASPAPKDEPIKDLMNRLGLVGTAQQVETIIRWSAERGSELLR